ncbi:MAG TPA: hypothetical protein VJ603_08345 [Paucimonas sp.]|nr:hypothetical protein [Paucimonas sp.]
MDAVEKPVATLRCEETVTEKEILIAAMAYALAQIKDANIARVRGICDTFVINCI